MLKKEQNTLCQVLESSLPCMPSWLLAIWELRRGACIIDDVNRIQNAPPPQIKDVPTIDLDIVSRGYAASGNIVHVLDQYSLFILVTSLSVSLAGCGYIRALITVCA